MRPDFNLQAARLGFLAAGLAPHQSELGLQSGLEEDQKFRTADHIAVPMANKRHYTAQKFGATIRTAKSTIRRSANCCCHQAGEKVILMSKVGFLGRLVAGRLRMGQPASGLSQSRWSQSNPKWPRYVRLAKVATRCQTHFHKKNGLRYHLNLRIGHPAGAGANAGAANLNKTSVGPTNLRYTAARMHIQLTVSFKEEIASLNTSLKEVITYLPTVISTSGINGFQNLESNSGET